MKRDDEMPVGFSMALAQNPIGILAFESNKFFNLWF